MKQAATKQRPAARERIPVYQPTITDEDRAVAVRAMESGMISGSGGNEIRLLEEAFTYACEVEHAVAVSSGTAALHLAAALCHVGPGDEVAVSACTNIATAIGPVTQGATIVPVDVDPETWCMDPIDLARAMSDRTRAVFVVHAYGHPANMPVINQIAQGRKSGMGPWVIEDAAEALGATVDGRPVGGLGDAAVFSLYANKPVTSGEGGILTIRNEAWAERARRLRNLAFGEPRFKHLEVGWNYRLSNVLAALAMSQMLRLDAVCEAKRDLAARYSERLADIPWLRLPVERPWARSIYWMYCVVLNEDAPVNRDALVARLHDDGIETRNMFCPMNLQPALSAHMRSRPCPVAESLWRRGFYLPSSPSLTNAELDRICAALYARGSRR